MKRTRNALCGLLITLLTVGCGEKKAAEQSAELPDIFPDYVDVTVPSNIAPLNFQIADASHMQATLTNASGESLHASGSTFVDIPQKEWAKLLAHGGDVQVEVSAWTKEHPDGIAYKPFTIHVAKEEIDPWVSYRLIPPGYEGWNYMGIKQRCLTSYEEQTIVNNRQNGRGCMNCHIFANYQPDEFTFHSRSAGGGTIIKHKGKMEKVDIKSMGPGKHGSYNCWHPSTKYIAFSSNSTHQSFYGQSKDKIEVYDLWSDLIVYDVEKHEVLADDRFLDTLNLEIFPTFSPDGKWLYFSTAHPVIMPKEVDKLHYSIIRVPFDEKDGSLGAVDTVYSAFERGGTALMPRISPDGRYMLYTLATCGAFNLYHNESDLQMMDLQTGESVDTRILNSKSSESYHVWSSNGNWVVFTSKRIDNRYTRLFIAHWDGKKFGKPFLLPQRDPEQNVQLMFAYNIPELISGPVEVDPDELSRLLTPQN